MATESKSLLVVDDEATICFAMRAYFSGRGYAVDVASSVDEARALAHKEYCAALVDLRLATDDEGFEVVSLLREQHAGMCIVVVTAHGTPEIEREAISRGANAMVAKPASLPRLEALISHPPPCATDHP